MARAKYTIVFTLLLTLFMFVVPTLTSAQGETQQTNGGGIERFTYIPLTDIPFVSSGANRDIIDYLNALYLLAIVVGALIAVIKIAIAGFQWMMTDSVTSKGDAKASITGALLGLAILLATFLVLNTINPDLTNLNILREADPINPLPQSALRGGTTVVTEEEVEERFEAEAIESQTFATVEEAETALQNDTACAETGATANIEENQKSGSKGGGSAVTTYSVVCPPKELDGEAPPQRVETEAEARILEQQCEQAGNGVGEYRQVTTGGRGGSNTSYEVTCQYGIIKQTAADEEEKAAVEQTCTDAGGTIGSESRTRTWGERIVSDKFYIECEFAPDGWMTEAETEAHRAATSWSLKVGRSAASLDQARTDCAAVGGTFSTYSGGSKRQARCSNIPQNE